MMISDGICDDVLYDGMWVMIYAYNANMYLYILYIHVTYV